MFRREKTSQSVFYRVSKLPRSCKKAFILTLSNDLSLNSYGGDEYVDINSLKFLKRDFIKLPIQAIRVRLSNLKFNSSEICENLRKNKYEITQALLHIVFKKNYQCSFNGVIYDQLCVQLDERITKPIDIVNNLNQQIIDEEYATEALDTDDIDVSF